MLGDDFRPVLQPGFGVDIDREHARGLTGANSNLRVRPFLPPGADLIFVGCGFVEATGALDFLPVGILVARGQRPFAIGWKDRPLMARIE